ncbi:MAG: nucleotidyltransferase family protein [Thaumarchaeota archaeon]|nr:MAG: nucleotidyltransferase family protein [Nitrososphaerota archaeon]
MVLPPSKGWQPRGRWEGRLLIGFRLAVKRLISTLSANRITLKAIILSGGQGLRLRPLTDDKPKPLIPVNGRPISEHQIEWLRKNPAIDGIVFACGYRWEKLRDHFGKAYQGLSIDYSVEEEPLGTGGAIKKALARVEPEGSAVILNGDVITDLELKRMADWHSSTAQTTVTMLVVPYKSRFGVVYIDKLRTVRKFEEKPEFPDVWINGGVYVANVKRLMKYLPEKGDIERETFPKLVPYELVVRGLDEGPAGSRGRAEGEARLTLLP